LFETRVGLGLSKNKGIYVVCYLYELNKLN